MAFDTCAKASAGSGSAELAAAGGGASAAGAGAGAGAPAADGCEDEAAFAVGVAGFVVAHPVGWGLGTLESFADVKRDVADGEESRWEGRGETEVPSLRAAGEAAEVVGPAFSRKRLLTLSEVNFLAGAPATCGDGAAAGLCVAALSACCSLWSCIAVNASTSRSDPETGMEEARPSCWV